MTHWINEDNEPRPLRLLSISRINFYLARSEEPQRSELQKELEKRNGEIPVPTNNRQQTGLDNASS